MTLTVFLQERRERDEFSHCSNFGICCRFSRVSRLCQIHRREDHQIRSTKGHPGEDVYGWGGIHAHQQKRPLRLPVQVDRGRRADHRPDHRDPVGLVARPGLDPGGRLIHRLGSGLLQHDGGHAERRRLLRRVEPQADLAPRPRYPPGVHLFLPAPHRRGVRECRGQHGRRTQGGPDGLALPDDRRHPRRPDDLQVAQGHHPDDRRDRGDRPPRHLSRHHPSLRPGPRGVHSQQPARLGNRRFRLLLLRCGSADLAFRAADQLCGLLHRFSRALFRDHRDLHPAP